MVNKAIIVGRLTRDPELKRTAGGISVTSFTVAADRPYSKDKEKKTDFIDCVAWRGTAEFVERYFRKGDAIGVDGRIQVEDYTDKNGNKRRRFEVVADQVSFVGGKPRRDTPEDPDDFEEVDLDDDLPWD